MGDASLSLAQSLLQGDDLVETQFHPTNDVREINVLVTGFGAFKTFDNNPSYLVAGHLPNYLDPGSDSASVAFKNLRPTEQIPIRNPDPRPYRIHLHVYPIPVKVAYSSVYELIPRLVQDPLTQSTLDFHVPENGFDYALHIGMAAGRENYTLETLAHRNHYKLKDVDDRDGSEEESIWKELGLPDVLDVGWNKDDVLSRWEALTRQREDEYEQREMKAAGWSESASLSLVEIARLRSLVFLGKGKRAAVKLSRDAGRYLCEFIYYTSLVTRWREANGPGSVPKGEEAALEQLHNPKEKIGKIAFLHVPGGTEKHDIARGVRVAESVILALVSSWEAGYRNPDVYGNGKHVKQDFDVLSMAYESKGTGDR